MRDRRLSASREGEAREAEGKAGLSAEDSVEEHEEEEEEKEVERRGERKRRKRMRRTMGDGQRRDATLV